ncbi:helix-turn-helix domain-containing protein [Pontibacter kalidii]|uniref:helix-turn-helix domain-containing protein n=1 Tax=Pontibacter kalidii TaxID=2592049 RepID=UPI00225907BB|nr:helix-turn-helix domain-containing protein [Pontibacter kalidii]
MIDNPFSVIERRLNRLETLLLELKEKSSTPRITESSDRCTLPDALAITGLSKSKLYKLTASKEIPHKRFGRRLVFSRKELLAWVETQTVERNTSCEVNLQLARSANNKIRKGGKR